MDRRDGNVERKERGASAANSGDGRGGPDGADHFDIHEALKIGGHNAVCYLGTRFVRSVRGPTCAADVIYASRVTERKEICEKVSFGDRCRTRSPNSSPWLRLHGSDDESSVLKGYSEIFADKNQYDLWK